MRNKSLFWQLQWKEGVSLTPPTPVDSGGWMSCNDSPCHHYQPGWGEVALGPPHDPMPVPVTACEGHLPEVTIHCRADVSSTPPACSMATPPVQREYCLLILYLMNRWLHSEL